MTRLMFVGFTSLFLTSLVWANADVVSINFASDKANGLATVESGLPEYWTAYWNNTTGAKGTAPSLRDGAGIVLTGSNNLSTTMSYSCGTTWSSAEDPTYIDRGTINNGWLTGATDVTVTIENVPYETYDVILYYSADWGDTYGTPQVNNTFYTMTQDDANATAVATATSWGSAALVHASSPVLGINTMRIANQTASTLTVFAGTGQSATLRTSLAAIQVVNKMKRPSISVNFNSSGTNSGGASAGTASSSSGLAEYSSAYWNQPAGPSGTSIVLNDYTNQSTTAMLTYSSPSVYGALGNRETILNGWFGDGADVNITVDSIPYKAYDVILYYGGDWDASWTLATPRINGVYYTISQGDQSATPIDISAPAEWGWINNAATTPVLGVNVIRIAGQTTPTFSYSGQRFSSTQGAAGVRYSVAALQIINVEDDISPTTWSEAWGDRWENRPEATGAVSNISTTFDFDVALTASRILLQGTHLTSFTQAKVPFNVAHWDFSNMIAGFKLNGDFVIDASTFEIPDNHPVVLSPNEGNTITINAAIEGNGGIVIENGIVDMTFVGSQSANGPYLVEAGATLNFNTPISLVDQRLIITGAGRVNFNQGIARGGSYPLAINGSSVYFNSVTSDFTLEWQNISTLILKDEAPLSLGAIAAQEDAILVLDVTGRTDLTAGTILLTWAGVMPENLSLVLKGTADYSLDMTNNAVSLKAGGTIREHLYIDDVVAGVTHGIITTSGTRTQSLADPNVLIPGTASMVYAYDFTPAEEPSPAMIRNLSSDRTPSVSSMPDGVPDWDRVLPDQTHIFTFDSREGLSQSNNSLGLATGVTYRVITRRSGTKLYYELYDRDTGKNIPLDIVTDPTLRGSYSTMTLPVSATIDALTLGCRISADGTLLDSILQPTDGVIHDAAVYVGDEHYAYAVVAVKDFSLRLNGKPFPSSTPPVLIPSDDTPLPDNKKIIDYLQKALQGTAATVKISADDAVKAYAFTLVPEVNAEGNATLHADFLVKSLIVTDTLDIVVSVSNRNVLDAMPQLATGTYLRIMGATTIDGTYTDMTDIPITTLADDGTATVEGVVIDDKRFFKAKVIIPVS